MLSKERRDQIWAMVFVAALLLVAAFGAYSGRVSARPPVDPALLAQQVGQAAAIPEPLAAPTADDCIADFTWQLVLVTGALAFIALLQLGVFSWQGYHLRQTVRSMTKAERAYVKLSHLSKTSSLRGLMFDGNGAFWVKVQTKNFGRTPASILGSGPINRRPILTGL